MKTTFKVLAICLLFGFTFTANIIPHETFPVMMMNPSIQNNGETITFRFYLNGGTANQIGPKAYSSNGLAYKQFIGVEFPPNLTSFDLSASVLAFGCTLSSKKGTVTTTYSVTPVQSIASPLDSSISAETNVAYCRLDDLTTNVPLSVGPETLYTLTINLTNLKFSNKFIDNICLFTSSANHKEKVIIDSLPVFGNLGMYENYAAYTPKDLEVSASVIKVTQGPSADSSNSSNDIFPDNTFNIELSLRVNGFINSRDHVIVFHYPSTAVTAPTTVESLDVTADEPLKAKIKSTLRLQSFSTDGVSLEDIDEDLIPNRMFKIKLGGIKALNNVINTSQILKTVVYYKNTYSIISQVESSIITVKPSTITLTANHPEDWDIYANAAWPIKFTFKSNNDISTGGWIQIQHSNAIKQSTTGGDVLAFVASTCDFSSGDFDNTFGKREPCFPLQNSLDYRGTLTTEYNGSGIFFHMKSLTKNTVYTMTVWVYADACGNTTRSFAEFNTENKGYVKPKFTMNIFKTIDAAKIGTDRLKDGTNGNVIIAKNSEAVFGGKCWTSTPNEADVITNTDGIAAADTGIKSLNSGKTIALVSYIELTMWDTYNWSVVTAVPTTVTVTPFTVKANGGVFLPEARYLYPKDSTTKIADDSYFFVDFKLLIITGAPKDSQVFPGVYDDTSAMTGKYILQFSKNWFKAGKDYTGTNKECFVAWSFSSLSVYAVPAANANCYASNAKNQFFNTNTTAAQEGLDSAKTNVSGTGIFRIVSKYNRSSSNGFSINLAGTIFTANDKYFGVLSTSCVKWKSASERPNVTSLYSYIDIQFQSTYLAADSNDLGDVLGVFRLIKLFPESGVWQDSSFSDAPSADTKSFLTNHHAYTTVDGGVCLLELNAALLTAQKGTSPNTLAIWLFNATLLESDYNDVSSVYPAAPLATGIKAYGSSSAPLLDTNSFASTPTTTKIYVPLLRKVSMVGNVIIKGVATIALNTSPKTDYMFFMGSQLLFTGVGTQLTESTETSLFVPYYCPRNNASLNGTTGNAGDIKSASIFPTAIATWISMTSYKDITKVTSTFASGQSGANMSYAVQVMKNSDDTDKQLGTTAGEDVPVSTFIQTTLRWSPYTTSDTDSLLYVFNGTVAAAGSDNAKYSGFTLFLRSQITFDSTNAVEFTAGQLTKKYDGTTNFYANGVVFQKAVYSGLSSSNTAGTTVNPAKKQVTDGATSDAYYKYINRPSIETFVDSQNNFSTNNYAAIFAASAQKTINVLGTNYVTEGSTSAFLLDIASDIGSNNSANFSSPSIVADISEIFQSDPAGNFKTNVNPPKTVPKGSNVVITSAAVGTNSLCAMVNGTNAIADCTNASGTITCPVLALGNTFTICCYNIKIDATITLTKASVTLPANATFSTHLTSEIYSAATQISASPNAFTYSTNNANIAAVGSAKLNKVTYSHVVQENGYGKARFEIVLPRQPTRDMKLEVLGSLSALKIASEEPRCVATFSETGTYGKNWDQGDILIDICSVKKFETSPPIVVTTKKMIYKCGITFQKTLYIDVWPIKVYNWNATGASKSFTVDMKTKGGEAIAKNSTPADLTMAATSAAVTTTQSETLCPVTKITPSIPGLPGDYAFTFDLETNKAALDGKTVDEVSIFFPYRYYGSFINNIICMKGSDILNCTFSEEGILNIRVSLTTGAKEAITLLGVPNPYMATDYSFVCTVNSTNVQTGVRTNIITGSGKLSGGITSTGVTQSGALRFLKVTNAVNPSSIRTTSTHIFRVAFDKAIALTSINKITVNNTPCVYVFLPQEYLLAYYSNTVPSVEITQYNKDNENKITAASTPIAIGTTTVSGNIIKVPLTATSYEFDTNFMYWDIKLTNLMNPAESTESVGPPQRMTTCMYQVVLTNSDNTACYRTMSNLNTYSTDKLKTAFDRGAELADQPLTKNDHRRAMDFVETKT
ncbi:MAG: hypothetical protein GY861_12075, partial [bacterium]|nr:hypothetical protein [bacterium]